MTKVVLPSVRRSKCLSCFGTLAMRGGDNREPTSFDEDDVEDADRRKVPCLEPISTTLHSSLWASQYTVAWSLETSISFNLTLGMPTSASGASRPSCNSEYPSIIASLCLRGRIDVRNTTRRSDGVFVWCFCVAE